MSDTTPVCEHCGGSGVVRKADRNAEWQAPCERCRDERGQPRTDRPYATPVRGHDDDLGGAVVDAAESTGRSAGGGSPAPAPVTEDAYSLGFGEGWRTARGFDGDPECWDRMLDRASAEMASWSGPVPSGADEFRPYAERVLRAALEMRP